MPIILVLFTTLKIISVHVFGDTNLDALASYGIIINKKNTVTGQM